VIRPRVNGIGAHYTAINITPHTLRGIHSRLELGLFRAGVVDPLRQAMRSSHE